MRDRTRHGLSPPSPPHVTSTPLPRKPSKKTTKEEGASVIRLTLQCTAWTVVITCLCHKLQMYCHGRAFSPTHLCPLLRSSLSAIHGRQLATARRHVPTRGSRRRWSTGTAVTPPGEEYVDVEELSHRMEAQDPKGRIRFLGPTAFSDTITNRARVSLIGDLYVHSP